MTSGANLFRILYYKIFKYYTHDITSKVGFTMVIPRVKISYRRVKFSPHVNIAARIVLKRHIIIIHWSAMKYPSETNIFILSIRLLSYKLILKINLKHTKKNKCIYSPILWLTYFLKIINLNVHELMFSIFFICI